MKTSCLLSVLVFLLGVFKNGSASNPDSEMVQDSSESKEGKSVKMRSADSQMRSLGNSESERYPGLPGIRVFRPFVVGSQVFWREIEISESIDRLRDRNPMVTVWRELRKNRPNSVVPNNNNNATDINRRNNPQRQPNNDRISGDNVPYDSQDETANKVLSTSYNGENTKPSTGINDRNNGNIRPGEQNPNSFQTNPTGQNRRQYRPFIRDFNRYPSNGEKRVPSVPQNYQPTPNRPPPRNSPGNSARNPSSRVSPDSNLFANIVNDFAFKLVEKINFESNFVVSPLSIFIALAMCYLGSDGNTKAQLEQAMGMNDNAIHGEHLHQGIKDLISLLRPVASEYELSAAMGIFLGKNFTAEAQFHEQLVEYYAAELRNLDFGNPESSLSAINEWVAEKSRNRIPRLIDTPPPPLTRLVLLNAVYFKGIWKTLFPQNLTYDGRFHVSEGINKEVPTMILYGETFSLFRSDEHRHSFIKLPYEGDKMSMIIALPYSQFGKPMPSVTDQTLCYVQDAMAKTRLDSVAIPKFRLEYTSSLRRALVQLGVNDLFNRNAVNLRKLRQKNDVYVSAILHKAIIEVNEEGTTASATTAVNFVPLSLRNTTDFIVNHPFAFYIVHEPTGLVLFYGKIFDIGVDEGSPRGNRGDTMRVRQRPNSETVNNDTFQRNPSRTRLHGAVSYENKK